MLQKKTPHFLRGFPPWPTSATSRRRVLTHMCAMFSHTVALLMSLTAAYALSMSPTVRCREKSSSAADVFSSTYMCDVIEGWQRKVVGAGWKPLLAYERVVSVSHLQFSEPTSFCSYPFLRCTVPKRNPDLTSKPSVLSLLCTAVHPYAGCKELYNLTKKYEF